MENSDVNKIDKNQKLKQYGKEYYEKNKDKILAYGTEKVTCDICGKKYQRRSKISHENTVYHQHASEKKSLKDEIRILQNTIIKK